MSKAARPFIPDLDALDSPLLSPTGLRGVPGSAIAEKIFNDPLSWDDTSGDEGDYPEDIETETLAWFTEEIEKLRRESATFGKDRVDLLRGDKKENKEAELVPKRDGNAGWKAIAHRGSVRPISLAGLFAQSNDDFSKEIQQHLSKILDSEGIKHHVSPRPMSSLSPYASGYMNTPSTAESSSTPITSSSVTEMSPSVNPASATLSFLEYYGIYPDSPLLDGRKLPRKKTLRRPPQSKDSPSGFFWRVPSTGAVAQPRSLRLSSVPPPGLEVPFQAFTSNPAPQSALPGLIQNTNNHDALRSTPPQRSRDDSNVQEVVVSLPPGSGLSPRSRPLPVATGASPPRSNLFSADIVHTGSPTVRVRRLPSIPAEPQPQVSSIFPHDQGVSRQNTPPPQSSAPTSGAFISRSNSSTTLSPSMGSAMSSMRTPLTGRSPLSVPLGPRTRGRSSDAGRRLMTVQPC